MAERGVVANRFSSALAWIETRLDAAASLLAEMLGPLSRRGEVAVPFDPARGVLTLPGSVQEASLDLGPEPGAGWGVSGKPVRLIVGADHSTMRTIELPAAARTYMQSIVAQKIPELSPVAPSQLAYGYRILTAAAAAATLQAEVYLVRKNRLDPALTALRAAGAPGASVSVATADGARIGLAMPGADSGAFALRVRRWLTRGVYTGAAIIAFAYVAAPFIDGWFDDAARALTVRQQDARRIVHGGRGMLAAKTDAERQAVAAKGAAVPVLGALNALAEAMPDGSYATEITFDGQQFRLTGRSTDVPGMLTKLEESGAFAQSALQGPVRKAEGGPDFFDLSTTPVFGQRQGAE